MSSPAFALVWGLSYSDIEFLQGYGLQSSLVYVNTRMVQSILQNPKVVAGLSSEYYLCLTPLIYSHISPYGRFEVDLDSRINFERMVA